MTSQNRRPLPEMFLPILEEEKQPETKPTQNWMPLFYVLCFCILQKGN